MKKVETIGILKRPDSTKWIGIQLVGSAWYSNHFTLSASLINTVGVQNPDTQNSESAKIWTDISPDFRHFSAAENQTLKIRILGFVILA